MLAGEVGSREMGHCIPLECAAVRRCTTFLAVLTKVHSGAVTPMQQVVGPVRSPQEEEPVLHQF